MLRNHNFLILSCKLERFKPLDAAFLNDKLEHFLQL